MALEIGELTASLSSILPPRPSRGADAARLYCLDAQHDPWRASALARRTRGDDMASSVRCNRSISWRSAIPARAWSLRAGRPQQMPVSPGIMALEGPGRWLDALIDILGVIIVRAQRRVGGWRGRSCPHHQPPIISATTGNSAAQRTVHQAMSGSSAITVLGTASTGYLQNLVFHKNAFALAVVPMERPAGAVDVARKSYKGLSVRVVPYYDGTNDISNYRLDCLFGVRLLDGRLAMRLSGTAAA